MRRVLFAVLLVVACANVAAAESNEHPVCATYGEFAQTARLTRSFAEQGYARAQFNLGVLFYEGHCVPQDYQEALKWSRKAAQQGFALAQRHLGLMYAKGKGVPQDVTRAYMWFNFAAAALSGERGKAAMEDRDRVASQMTAAQIEKAQEMARRCQDTKFKECD